MLQSGISWQQNIDPPPFYLHNVREACCCACSPSPPTMNLNYSARSTTWNIIRQRTLCDSAVPLPAPIRELAVLMSVPVVAQWSQRSWPFANYSPRNPECVSLGLGAAQPTQMFGRMKPCDCALSALWPMECAFKEDCKTVNFSEGFSLVAPCLVFTHLSISNNL